MAVSDLMNKLFNWKTEVVYNDIPFYVRIVSDSVIEDARKHALVQSRKLRKALRDPDSNEYLIYIDPSLDYVESELKDLLQAAQLREAVGEYIRATPRPIVEQVGDSLEAQERYAADLEERDKAYNEAIEAYAKEVQDRYMQRLNNMTLEVLQREFRRVQTDRVCEDLYAKEFEYYVLASAVYLDPKCTKRAFTYDDFLELPENFKTFLRNAYNSINISGEDIKN